jgi:hypothetical protein
MIATATSPTFGEPPRGIRKPLLELPTGPSTRPTCTLGIVLSEASIEFRERVRTDPEYCDPTIAGMWAWGLCCWIGGGWCTEQGGTADGERKQQLPSIAGDSGASGRGIHRKRPSIGESANGRGLNGAPAPADVDPFAWGRRPQIGGGDHQYGQGVHAGPPRGKFPQLGGRSGADVEKGLNRKHPVLSGRSERENGHGVHRATKEFGACEARLAWLREWFGQLRDRLRLVRVCCGDWLRVCDSPSVTTALGLTGVFLDPPYAHNLERMRAWVRHLQGDGPAPGEKTSGKASRDRTLYATDSGDVDLLVARVHVYCVERGRNRAMRIALCGYAGEHEALEAAGWDVVAWKSQGGYGNRAKGTNVNSGRERIWFSPHCEPWNDMPLFASKAAD